MPSADDIYGTLPDWAIKSFIKTKKIKIKNLSKDWKKTLDQVSMDFHLGKRVIFPNMGRHVSIDLRKGVDEKMYQKISLKIGEPVTLRPQQFFITETLEDVTIPADIVGRLEGKSSLARLGIVIHQTAGRIDPGWSGPLALEVKNNSDNDVVLYSGDKICAVSFERLMHKVENPYEKSQRYYKNKNLVSQIHKNNAYRS